MLEGRSVPPWIVSRATWVEAADLGGRGHDPYQLALPFTCLVEASGTDVAAEVARLAVLSALAGGIARSPRLEAASDVALACDVELRLGWVDGALGVLDS